MFKKVAAQAKRIIGFLRENVRYVGVLFLFLVAVFYSLVIAKNEEKKEQAAKISGKTEAEQIVRTPDLDHSVRSKTYHEVLSSRGGDTYRVLARLESDAWVKVRVSARALDGKTLNISTFDVPKGEVVHREAVFSTDGEYRDIVFSLEEPSSPGIRAWSDESIFIDDVSVTRLSIHSLSEAKRLQPTVFGGVEHMATFISAPQAQAENIFDGSRDRIGQYFEPTEESITGLRFRGEVIGKGGAGSYVAEIGECANEACGWNDMNVRGKFSFHAADLERYRVPGTEDTYEVPLSATLRPGKLHYVGMNAAKTDASRANGLLLRKLEVPAGFSDALFAAVSLRKSDILPTARIEDVGNAYRYEYRMRNTEADLADVYDSNARLKFDKSLAGLAMPQDKDASMTFRVDMLHPVVSMRVSAKGIATKSGQFVMEYSLDEEEWIEIPYVQREETPQVFDAVILATGKSVVYIRARSVQDGSKFNDWGIKDLAISAILEKR